MVDYDRLISIAEECGFDHVGKLDTSTIEMRTEVRDACAVNKCKHYDTNWVCPPACGTLEECSDHVHKYSSGLILQSTGELEDSMDYEAMMELAERHSETLNKFTDIIKKEFPEALILGDGSCKRCTKCTYPDEPCRFPEKKISAMEAYGMVVSDVCKNNNINYYYGPGTLTYVGCVLVE